MGIRFLLVGCILFLLLGMGLGCSPPEVATPPDGSPIIPDYTLPPADGQSTFLPSFTDVVKLVRPSVVAINTEVVTYDIFNRPFSQEGAGSGWIVGADGLIVTNYHVVEGAENVTVTLDDGRTFPAVTIRADALTDLAVVQIDANDLPAASIGNSSKLQVGEWVMAIGNPLGLGISAKEGIISRQGVSITVSSGQTLGDLIETSAAINPGNSGGPLVNMAGEVIGITSVKIATVGVEGLGYAISSNTARPIIEKLIQVGYVVRPWLGVVVTDVTQDLQLRYGLAVDGGAFITQIVDGSPADKAGLKAGDIIVGFDGKEVTTSQDLVEAIHSAEIGGRVEIVYWRGKQEDTTHTVLIQSPPPS